MKKIIVYITEDSVGVENVPPGQEVEVRFYADHDIERRLYLQPIPTDERGRSCAIFSFTGSQA